MNANVALAPRSINAAIRGPQERPGDIYLSQARGTAMDEPTAMAKELLKLQKKLREIESIERKLQGGEMVDELQRAKAEQKPPLLAKILIHTLRNIVGSSPVNPESH